MSSASCLKWGDEQSSCPFFSSLVHATFYLLFIISLLFFFFFSENSLGLKRVTSSIDNFFHSECAANSLTEELRKSLGGHISASLICKKIMYAYTLQMSGLFRFQVRTLFERRSIIYIMRQGIDEGKHHRASMSRKINCLRHVSDDGRNVNHHHCMSQNFCLF